jgi:hypothetical protein
MCTFGDPARDIICQFPINPRSQKVVNLHVAWHPPILNYLSDGLSCGFPQTILELETVLHSSGGSIRQLHRSRHRDIELFSYSRTSVVAKHMEYSTTNWNSMDHDQMAKGGINPNT